MTSIDSATTTPNRALQRFDRALDELDRASSLGKALQQTSVYQTADELMASAEGMRALYERADRFDSAGVFAGGPWEDPGKLQAPLVAGSFRVGGVYPVLEALSELRMLAIAEGRAEHSSVTSKDAREFLYETLALNLDLLFQLHTEEHRSMGEPQRRRAEHLFRLIADVLPLEPLYRTVVEEIELVCAQRPVQTAHVRQMIEMSTRVESLGEEAGRLDPFVRAIQGPSPLSADRPHPRDYRTRLTSADSVAVEREARAFAESMNRTGLVSRYAAIFLRQRRKDIDLVGLALGLAEGGMAELRAQHELARELIAVAIRPATAQAAYGLAGVLDRSLLSRQEVAVGLRRLADLPLLPEVRERLMATVPSGSGVNANGVLLAGALSVIGQPLGVGQGNMPTCQAARGISLWAQHAPSRLLDMLSHAARDGLVELRFEGQLLQTNSQQVLQGKELDESLDALSLILVPHLDSLYSSIMQRVAGRGEDPHKWANPALYGHWVPTGFASVFDATSTWVTGFKDFVRLFYATHHPDYNDGYELVYPNPVGIYVTNNHGALVGPHAVSLQRVAPDPDGCLRAYFFNPNNEGRQDWGQGILPSVEGRGEVPGESSLPIEHFAARLYAFHYNPFEEGDAFAVPDDDVDHIENLARESWGKHYHWV